MPRPPISAAALALLVACMGDKSGEIIDDTGPIGVIDSDNDQDGFDSAEDCDDRDPAVNPQAIERCNQIDDDCDGQIDEDSPDAWVWYPDEDVDGYGDAANPVTACLGPDGSVPIGGDCDDSSRFINPGAAETCDGLDQDCDGQIDDDAIDASPWYPDLDGDTFGDEAGLTLACEAPADHIAEGGDCDDLNPEAYPGAPETCDELDQDCDGEIDEDSIDAETFYADADADAYGDPDGALRACALPAGAVTNALDCDDADPDRSPVDLERCDGEDDDCDGDIDEEAIDASTWYTDGDRDGYGDPDAAILACGLPAGATADGTDCDDAAAAAYPGGTEVCDDLDNDCDGDVDEADAADALTWHLDADLDGYGVPGASLTACEAPTGYARLDTDCDDSQPGVNPGAPEVCDNDQDDNCEGTDDGCLLTGALAVTAADARLRGAGSFDQAGEAVALGDLDGDGQDELIVGVSYEESGAISSAGAVFVYAADTRGTLSLSATTATAALFGLTASDHAGEALAVGDVDGDGLEDLLIGAPDEDSGGSGAGAAYLLYGPLSGSLALSAADTTLVGEDATDSAGCALAIGDLNGDGQADLVIGAEGEDAGGITAGAVYVHWGARGSTLDLSAASAKLTATSGNDAVGYAVAIAEDLDGDGIGELVIGAQAEDSAGSNAGAVYVVDSLSSGTTSLSAATHTLLGAVAGDAAGNAVAAPGDTNGDGYGDLLVGAPKHGGAGLAYWLPGPLSSGGLASLGYGLQGSASGDLAGTSLAGLGDVNGDGELDVAIGAPGVGGGDGAVYLLYGPISGSLSLSVADGIVAGSAASATGNGVSLAGDVDGDDFFDLFLGANQYGSAQGEALLFLGSGGW